MRRPLRPDDRHRVEDKASARGHATLREDRWDLKPVPHPDRENSCMSSDRGSHGLNGTPRGIRIAGCLRCSSKHPHDEVGMFNDNCTDDIRTKDSVVTILGKAITHPRVHSSLWALVSSRARPVPGPIAAGLQPTRLPSVLPLATAHQREITLGRLRRQNEKTPFPCTTYRQHRSGCGQALHLTHSPATTSACAPDSDSS